MAGEPMLVLAGELDMAAAPLIQRQVEQLLERHGALTVDLSELTFLDSIGIRALLRPGVRTTGARGDVARVLEVSGLIAPVMGWHR